MSDVIHIVYPEEELPEYLLKTVLLNESGLFLPASGIMRRKCGFSEVWYQKDGIRNLEETERLEEWALLEVLAELMECLLLAEQNFLLPGEIRICDEDIYVKKRQADVLFAGLVFHRDPIPETQAEGEKKIRNELISILKKRNQEGSLMECMDQGIEILERGRSGISILMNRFRCLAEESRAVDRIIRSEKRT